MGKRKNVDKPVEKNLSLPTSIVARVDLLLYSELEGRVPHGAWAKLVTRLLTEWADGVTAAGPQGPSGIPADDANLNLPGR